MRCSVGKARSTRQAAFTLVEIMIVVAIIGILVAIAVPGWMKARLQAQGKACTEAQTKMEGAVDNWAIDSGKETGETAGESDLVGFDKYLKTHPACPVGSSASGTPIVIPPVGSPAECPVPVASHLRV